MTPFVIFALPRSRTAWISRFLTYREWQCGHDEVRHCRTLEDVTAWLSQPCTGTVETAGAPFWRLLPDDVRVVVVRRRVEDVLASLVRLGFDADGLNRGLPRLDAKLRQIAARRDALVIDYADLADEATCARLFEHCLPYPHDPVWWRFWNATDVQINMGHSLRHYQAFAPQLTKLAKIAKQRMLATMRPMTGEIDGVTFQQEDFETWYRDGQKLFADHLVAVGEAPDNHAFKNLPLLRTLDAAGALQITTARSNGRMFGYLATLIGPSLESTDGIWATNTFFYASRAIRGLGMKLQRASIAALQARGVNEVFMLAGPRGDGPRMPALYRRLGADDCGQFFRLRLEA